MDLEKTKEDLPISRQVATYLKYSQNKHLTKYFRGTHETYLPEIQVEQTEQPLISENEEKLASPTSSLASNKKLEWDNGADIGYDNCSKLLHKSASLPSLSPKKRDNKGNSFDKSKSTEKITVISRSSSSSVSEALIEELLSTNESSSSSELKNKEIKITSRTTSSSQSLDKQDIYKSSSSSYSLDNKSDPNSKRSKQSENMSFIKQRIGLPGAESTPNSVGNTERKTDSDTKTSTPKRASAGIIVKSVNLCATKPVFLECLDDRKVGCKKIQVQMHVVQENKSVQTENNNWTKPKETTNQANQSIIFINCSSSTEKNTQTESDIACNSFEFVPGNKVDNKTKNPPSQRPLSGSSSSGPQTSNHYSPPTGFSLQSSSEASNYPESRRDEINLVREVLERVKSPHTSTTSSKSPLGEVIALNKVQSLRDDINIHLEALQRLLKSKRYDKATKKRYIKKIVQKILDSTYIEDTTTSSSELFQPKRTKSDVTVSSTNNNKQQKLQDNIPWYPAPRKNLTIKTFSDEIVPEIKQKDTIPQRSRFTITNSEYILNSNSNHSSNSDKWKVEKTKSEKLWEQKNNKHTGEGDHLINFAQNERQHQINWIRNEINHLSKLKVLLEKPNIPIKNTTTTVYMVRNTNNSVPHGNRYVIETEIDSNGTNSEPMEFKLHSDEGDANYVVSKEGTTTTTTTTTGGATTSSKVRGNIEVTSDEKSTKITIRTNKVESKGKLTTSTKNNQEIQTALEEIKMVSRHTQITPEQSLENIVETNRKHQCRSSREEKGTSPRSPCRNIAPKEDYPIDGCDAKPSDVEKTKDDNEAQMIAEAGGTQTLNSNGIAVKKNVEETTRCSKCFRERKTNNKNKVCYEKYESEVNVWCTCNDRKQHQSTYCLNDDALARAMTKSFSETEEKEEQNGEQNGTNPKSDLEEKSINADLKPKENFMDLSKEEAHCSTCLKETQKLNSKKLNFTRATSSIAPKSPTKNNIRSGSMSPEIMLKKKDYETDLGKKEKKQIVNKQNSEATSPIGTKAKKQIKNNRDPEPLTRLKRTLTTLTKGNGKQDMSSKGDADHRCSCDTSLKCRKDLKNNTISNQSKKTVFKTKSKAFLKAPLSADYLNLPKNSTVQKIDNYKLSISRKFYTEPKGINNVLYRKEHDEEVDEEQKEEEEEEESRESPEREEGEGDEDYGTSEYRETSEETKAFTSTTSTGTGEDDEEKYETDEKYEDGGKGDESDTSVQFCCCCKKSSTTFKLYQQKLNHEAIQLCRPCYKATQKFGLGCHHISDYCYTVIDTQKLNNIRRTVHDLNKMKQTHCTCKGKNIYCQYCKLKLAKTTKTRNGIAYAVGFEIDTNKPTRRKKRHPMEEIKLLVPPIQGNLINKKKHKNTAPATYTLQEYLKINRPDFVENAERRRKQLAKLEEINRLRQNQKEMAIFKNNRIFTEKEIKAVNRRICKNLPEIQEKVLVHKQNLVKEANRLSAQIFNNKLRTAVLKGQVNVPIMTSVIEL